MAELVNQSGSIFVNVNELYFKFIDVPGDGDCFFHSVLKNDIISDEFKCVQDIRVYLHKIVLETVGSDYYLQSIFNYCNHDPFMWCINIVQSGKWANRLDVLVFTYIMKMDVITIGNYLNGFVINSHKQFLHNLLNVPINTLADSNIYI